MDGRKTTKMMGPSGEESLLPFNAVGVHGCLWQTDRRTDRQTDRHRL